MMNKPKVTTIFKQQLAGYLMMRGFVLINIRKSEDNSGRNVFYFKDSAELQNAICEYKKLKK